MHGAFKQVYVDIYLKQVYVYRFVYESWGNVYLLLFVRYSNNSLSKITGNTEELFHLRFSFVKWFIHNKKCIEYQQT